ncbi:Probable prolyl 4-hydroxylase 12 [Linum grandiflorum]
MAKSMAFSSSHSCSFHFASSGGAATFINGGHRIHPPSRRSPNSALQLFRREFTFCILFVSRKELRDKEEFNDETFIQLRSSMPSNRMDPSRVVSLSWRPRVFLNEGFLTDEECDHLIATAEAPKEEIAGNGDHSIQTAKKRKLASKKLLSDADVKSKIRSDCAKSSDILEPAKGKAILLFNVRLDGSPDPSSSHSRCPVQEGEMWVATKLFFVRPVNVGRIPTRRRSDVSSDKNDECTDEDDNCPSWAAKGECQKNPVYMIGSDDYFGTCRKSCKVC